MLGHAEYYLRFGFFALSWLCAISAPLVRPIVYGLWSCHRRAGWFPLRAGVRGAISALAARLHYLQVFASSAAGYGAGSWRLLRTCGCEPGFLL